MKHHRASSPRAIKLVSLALCFSLIAAAVLPLGSTGAHESNPVASASGLKPQSGLLSLPGRALGSFLTLLQGGGLPSVPGPNLPDLDAARQTQTNEPAAPPSIASVQSCEDCAPACPDCQINRKPIALHGGPYFGSAAQPIDFNGLGSFDPDPDDEISDYIWTFGDSSPAVEVHGGTPTHTYASPGVYTVTLRVRDLQNVSSNPASTNATVNAAPTPTPPPSASPTPSPSPGQTNAATFVSQSVPTTMTAGERYTVSVTMRNTGNTTWGAAHLYRLGSQSPQDNSLWGRARVYLPAGVAPGAEVIFNFAVLAPYSGADEPPPTPFQWRMVQDGVGYFGDLTQNLTVAITSNYQTPNQGAPEIGPFSNLFMSRIAVQHRTGQPGEDLLSGNYNLGLSLLKLSGRAGLNLNLGLSYNSLAAWTKVDPPYLPLMPPGFQQPISWTFDADRGFPSVGFRLGFPTLQGPFSNVQTAKNAYLLLTPSGARVELRQIGSSNVYEAADSSYLQLVDGGNGALLLRTTDGSQLAYLSINGEYRCTEIKDRNGNYITIKFDPLNGTANPGRVTSIIDTLGRTINFIYDQNYRLQSIEQLRSGQPPQVWASFGYSDLEVQPNFAATQEGGAEEPTSIAAMATQGRKTLVLGLPENNTVSVLTQVGLADGSRYNFDYTSWGQIWSTHHYAADGHELSYASYDLPQDNRDRQTDCPRFTQRQDWAENFNNNSPVTTTFQIDPNGEGQWGKVTAPDSTAYKEFFTTDYTAWRRGLVTRTEVYSPDSSTPKKTTITDWTQDNLSVAYQLNPRATATTISDSDGNRRRTTIDYDSFGLASDVFEWGPAGTASWSLMRRTHTDYELLAAYVNQRIIGLTKQQFLFGPEDSGQRLYNKMSYEYDAGGEFLQNQGNPVQHDANYGTGLVQGRGNVTKLLRWDVNYENDAAQATASTVGYNTSGSAVFSRDALAHQTTISYNDSFSTNGVDSTTLSFATLAYPTTVTDPDSFTSTAKYNYDLGAVTRQQDPKGAAQTTEYDPAGRVKRVTNAVNGAYTRFVYPASQTIVNKFTTIKDLATEAYTATVFDGAGRVRAVAGDFPNSTGRYSGQFTRYDIMGRAIQQTNPTEMTN
ncbi:MAG: PKD domain-containing protein, partial [Pyrinomonadaceae bacterium]